MHIFWGVSFRHLLGAKHLRKVERSKNFGVSVCQDMRFEFSSGTVQVTWFDSQLTFVVFNGKKNTEVFNDSVSWLGGFEHVVKTKILLGKLVGTTSGEMLAVGKAEMRRFSMGWLVQWMFSVISFAEKGTPNLVGQFGGGVTIYLQKSKPTKKSCDPKTGAFVSNEVSLVGGVEGFAHSSCQQTNTPT